MRSAVLLRNVVEHPVDEFLDLGFGGVPECLQLLGLAVNFLFGQFGRDGEPVQPLTCLLL